MQVMATLMHVIVFVVVLCFLVCCCCCCCCCNFIDYFALSHSLFTERDRQTDRQTELCVVPADRMDRQL